MLNVSLKESFVACLALWALAAAVKSPALQAFAISAAPEELGPASLRAFSRLCFRISAGLPSVCQRLWVATSFVDPTRLGAFSDSADR